MAKAKQVISKPVEIFVVADRSGSMAPLQQEAIGGFNRFLKEQQELPGKANLTLVLFDDKYEVPYNSVPLQDVEPLTTETFVPRGMTATYDAVGKAITELEIKNPERAIIMIITDGGENSSKEYTQPAVAAKVKAAEDRGWEVIFLAQNLDAKAAGSLLGVIRGMTMNLSAGGQGIGEAYTTMSASTASYRCEPLKN
jgi:hypothetical protein